MSPEQKRQIAFEVFDEDLARGMGIEPALKHAAKEGKLRPEDFSAIAEKELVDLHEHARKLRLRVVNAAIDVEVKIAASKRHPRNAFGDCFDLNDVAAEVQRRVPWPISESEVSRIEERYRDFVLVKVGKLSREYGSNA